MSNNQQILRLWAIMEGISYLLLFGVTMPLKYWAKVPDPNFFMGMIHGVLFIAYCLWVLIVAKELKWNVKTISLALIASLLPFGTFVADKKLFKTN